MSYRVVFTPEARDQLLSIYRYIAVESAVSTARAFVAAIVDYCESLRTFPNRGARLDDLRPGLRTVGFRKRATIAFAVDGQVSRDHRHLLWWTRRRGRAATTDFAAVSMMRPA